MQVYLLENLPGKGKAGEIINVNDGYGRNFIIRNGIGKAVDNAVMAKFKAEQESTAFKKNEEISVIRAIVQQLSQTVVSLNVKTGASGKMFGAVTGQEIASALESLGIKIDKKQFVFEQIKEPGSYKIKVKFSYGIEGDFALEVKSGN